MLMLKDLDDEAENKLKFRSAVRDLVEAAKNPYINQSVAGLSFRGI